MKEEWRSIEGYEGLYEVSNFGRVKSLAIMWQNGRVREERILKENLHFGYAHVTLCKNGTQKQWRVHRLVAIAFIPNPENKPFIDHINTVRNDNRVENLRWVTRQENYDNPISQKAQKESVARHVFQYDLEGNLLNIFTSITEASSKTGVRISAIQQSCSGYMMTAKGYIWRYKEDADTIMDIVKQNKKPKTVSRKVEALVNGKRVVFDSMGKASIALNLSRGILRTHNSSGDISWKLI